METLFYTSLLIESAAHPAGGKPTKRRKGEAKKSVPTPTSNFASPDCYPVRGQTASYLRQTPAP